MLESLIQNKLCMFGFDSSEFSYYMPENIVRNELSIFRTDSSEFS